MVSVGGLTPRDRDATVAYINDRLEEGVILVMIFRPVASTDYLVH